MRPLRCTGGDVGDGLAELVCSNSFRSDDAENNAVGLLHEALRRCGSLVMRAADASRVPAGRTPPLAPPRFSRPPPRGPLPRPPPRVPPQATSRLPPAAVGPL